MYDPTESMSDAELMAVAHRLVARDAVRTTRIIAAGIVEPDEEFFRRDALVTSVLLRDWPRTVEMLEAA